MFIIPIPIKSLTCLVRKASFLYDPSFIILKDIAYTESFLIRNYQAWHHFVTTPHYFATRPENCVRLYVQTDIRNIRNIRNPVSLKEVLQIDEFYKSDGIKSYNILVHIEKYDRTYFHKKYYHLTTDQVQRLEFK